MTLKKVLALLASAELAALFTVTGIFDQTATRLWAVGIGLLALLVTGSILTRIPPRYTEFSTIPLITIVMLGLLGPMEIFDSPGLRTAQIVVVGLGTFAVCLWAIWPTYDNTDMERPRR